MRRFFIGANGTWNEIAAGDAGSPEHYYFAKPATEGQVAFARSFGITGTFVIQTRMYRAADSEEFDVMNSVIGTA